MGGNGRHARASARERADRFSAWFKQALSDAKLSQSDMARALERLDPGLQMSSYRTRVSEFVNGQSVPGIDYCERIAAVLKIDLDYVLALAGHAPFRSVQGSLGPEDLEIVALAQAGGLSEARRSLIRLVHLADLPDGQWAYVADMVRFMVDKQEELAQAAPGTNVEG